MPKRVRTTRRLEVWLKDTSVPLFVLNSQRRLVFFNSGCEQLTGWTPPDVMGRVCDFVSEADPFSSEALLASLAPPANVWSGDSVVVSALVARRHGDSLPADIHFFPLTDVGRKVQASLGVIQPVSFTLPVQQVSVSQRLHTELAALRQSLRQKVGRGSLIGQSPAMKRVLEQVQLAHKSSVPVLFIGNNGTGRMHIARTIHDASEYGPDSFVPLDCHRLSAEHLEDTLIRMSAANPSNPFRPGTVYLDRVDMLTRDLQRRVLELIESGSPKPLRVMGACLAPLEPAVESGDFLSELYYGLSSLVISLPTLRCRDGDLWPLAQYFLEESNRGAVNQVTGFSDSVLQQFQRYNWPGNVGELRAVVMEAREACQGAVIEPAHLPFRFRAGVGGQTVGPAPRGKTEPLDPLLLRIEKEQIELALAEARQNKAKAAELLGITRPRLYRRMEVLGIIDHDAEGEARLEE